MQAEIKRISRKARRYSVRNWTNKKSVFPKFDEKNLGHFLRP